MATFGPDWWHHHGTKMRVQKQEKQNQFLVIAGSSATLKVVRRASTVGEGCWYVYWEVIYAPSERANGRVIFTTEELKSAFGLSHESGEHGEWLLKRYRASSAEQGKYVRRGDFLNIPCPGTGQDGDPNISLEIDGEIRTAMRQLLGE